MQVCLPLPRLRQVPPHLLSISPCLQSWVAHVGCCELHLPACLPACLPAFLSFLPSFLPSCLPAFLPSFLPSCVPGFLPSFLPSCVPGFLPSFLPSTRKREKIQKKTGKKSPKNNPPHWSIILRLLGEYPPLGNRQSGVDITVSTASHLPIFQSQPSRRLALSQPLTVKLRHFFPGELSCRIHFEFVNKTACSRHG